MRCNIRPAVQEVMTFLVASLLPRFTLLFQLNLWPISCFCYPVCALQRDGLFLCVRHFLGELLHWLCVHNVPRCRQCYQCQWRESILCSTSSSQCTYLSLLHLYHRYFLWLCRWCDLHRLSHVEVYLEAQPNSQVSPISQHFDLAGAAKESLCECCCARPSHL